MILRRVFLVGGVALAALLVTWSLTPPKVAEGPRLVILYAACTVNRDYLLPYNPEISYTPNLAEFARGGLVFTKHQTETGRSGIAYASLLSGTQAMSHGVYYHPARLDDQSYLITEAFGDSGYDVFFWADQDMASPKLNYGQGVPDEHTFWEKRRRRARKEQSGAFLRADDLVFQRVLDTLKRDSDYKAFLLTTFTVTHMPYNKRHVEEFCRAFPDECEGLSEIDIRQSADLFGTHGAGFQYQFDATVEELKLRPAEVANLIRVAELLYASNIYHLDGLFGDILQKIAAAGLEADTVVAFTADHGELMYRANAPYHWSHGFALTPDVLRVPLILRGTGVEPGRYEGVTRSIDVFPTLAGLSGVSLPKDKVTGVDLSATLLGKAPAPELIAFSHTALFASTAVQMLLPGLAERFPGNDPGDIRVAARRGDLTYKMTNPDGSGISPHVYNWEKDPVETDDLYDPDDEPQRAMIRRLVEYKDELQDGFLRSRPGAERRALTAGQKEALRALGYIR